MLQHHTVNTLFKLVSHVMSNVAWTGRCGSQEEKEAFAQQCHIFVAEKENSNSHDFLFLIIADLLTVSVKVEALIMLLLVRLSISRRHYTFESSNELNDFIYFPNHYRVTDLKTAGSKILKSKTHTAKTN